MVMVTSCDRHGYREALRVSSFSTTMTETKMTFDENILRFSDTLNYIVLYYIIFSDILYKVVRFDCSLQFYRATTIRRPAL